MLSFAVFDVHGPASQWPLRHAYLTGPDDAPIHADIRCEGGLIRCEKRSSDAAGICMQFPVDASAFSPDSRPAGRLTLQTCLLPVRSQPYLLSLELARHRLMLVINKMEDWALFELPADDPVMAAFEEARHAFTAAIVAQGVGATGTGADRRYTVNADQLARKALALAVDASELLALKQAQIQYAKRVSGELAAAAAVVPPANALTEHEARESRNALLGNVGVILSTPPLIGGTISPESFTPALQKLVSDSCDFVRMPMRWVEMEPTEGKYAFQSTDRWIEWAVRTAKLPVVAGPVVDFRPLCVPEWLYIWEHDYETLRELVYEHVKNIVTRYRRTVTAWTVVSGLHTNTNFAFTLEQIMDLTRICVSLVRKLQPGAAVQVEIDQPWGDACAQSARSIPPMLYAEMMAQAGINADVIALRVMMGRPDPGRATRDMMAFSAMLDRYATLEKPISVSALSAPSAPPATINEDTNQLDPGYWRSPWSPESQARWMTAALAVATSKPFVHSVCWNEIIDSPKSPSPEGLVTVEVQPKPSFRRLVEIREAIHGKRSPLSLAPLATPA
ncbi:MAG: endo-1,4-beta-xylanase [Phycisphaeraceae bacterium]|nr:endo-1,4-beta-xylanase [Phycisphaeraceae bacterium]